MKRISIVLLTLLLLVGCGSNQETSPEKPQRTEIKFTVGGGAYTLPVAFQAFSEQGWELEEDPEFQIPGNSYLEDVGIRKDKFYLRVTIFNTSSEPSNLKDGTVVQLLAEDRYVIQHYKDDLPPDIVVDEKTKWRMTEEEILNLYEQEPSIDENRVYRNYQYKFEDGQSITFQYHLEDDQLKYIILKDFGKGLNRD